MGHGKAKVGEARFKGVRKYHEEDVRNDCKIH
jgi:hypothetical protein